jgi:hypothetical protein
VSYRFVVALQREYLQVCKGRSESLVRARFRSRSAGYRVVGTTGEGLAWRPRLAGTTIRTIRANTGTGMVRPTPNVHPKGTVPAPTSDAAPPAARGTVPAWLVSWPAIVLGFFLCLVPGLVLLWLRPTSSTRVKTGVTIGVGVLTLAAMASSTAAPSQPSAATLTPQARTSSASTEQTPSASDSSTATPTSTPSPSLTPSSTPTDAATQTASGSAMTALLALPAKGRGPKTGYARDQFGSAWVDVDRNGCDTRNDMLRKYLTSKVMSGTCKVLSGYLADPYTATTIKIVYGGASEVDIDHVVPLSDAWQKGAARWVFAKRVAFANDPLNLQPTDSSANRQKGDGDAATWLPPNKSYRCDYVARQIAVKKKYGVYVTAAEKAAMIAVLSKCPGQEIPPPGSQPTIASNTGGSAPSSSTPAPTKSSGVGGGLDPRFATCKAAKAAGYGPYYRGKDPEYVWYTDRDKDGIVCE